MPIRYNKRSILNNTRPIDRKRVTKRNTNSLTYFSADSLKHPTQEDYNRIGSKPVIWNETTRLSNLAQQYLGNFEYWWVIAWYNGVAIEAQISTGKVLYIPLNLEDTLNILGV